MYYAVELVLRLFKASQERYLHISGIITHLKDFNALDSKIYNKREVPLLAFPFQYITTISPQNTLMVSISGHSDSVRTWLLVNYNTEHIMGMTLNVS